MARCLEMHAEMASPRKGLFCLVLYNVHSLHAFLHKNKVGGGGRERERFTSSPTFLCGNTPATLG